MRSVLVLYTRKLATLYIIFAANAHQLRLCTLKYIYMSDEQGSNQHVLCINFPPLLRMRSAKKKRVWCGQLRPRSPEHLSVHSFFFRLLRGVLFFELSELLFNWSRAGVQFKCLLQVSLFETVVLLGLDRPNPLVSATTFNMRTSPRRESFLLYVECLNFHTLFYQLSTMQM